MYYNLCIEYVINYVANVYLQELMSGKDHPTLIILWQVLKVYKQTDSQSLHEVL